MNGGQVVAKTLHQLGALTIFSVSGNQVLPIYDAAADYGLRIIHTRHESAAAYAAAAAAGLENGPGVVLVTAGPGYLAALPGIATASNMEVPLLLLSGATATSDAGAGGFQDMDQAAIGRAICKAAMSVSSVESIRAVVTEAWRLAQSSVPGPVLVCLPADLLLAECSGEPAADYTTRAVASSALDKIVEDELILNAMASRLKQAARPLVVARPAAARGAAGKALVALANRLGIKPVVADSPRGMMRDPKHLGITHHYKESDCTLFVAPADFATGFLMETTVARTACLLHIDAPGDPRPRRMPDLHSQLPPEIALPYLVDTMAGHEARVGDWASVWLSRPAEEAPISSSEALHPIEVARQVRDLLEADDIVVMDGGEFGQWMRLGLRDLPNPMLSNSKLGGIGGCIPMALGAAASGRPGRVVAFIGDGAFGYHASEFETAARYNMRFVVIVGNDARWAAEWHLQAARYGADRTFETSLLPARYDQVAMGLGAAGFYATDAASLHRALEASFAETRAACINVRVLSVRSPAF
jgi:acetolactate synthase-1/2/3 large subunit